MGRSSAYFQKRQCRGSEGGGGTLGIGLWIKDELINSFHLNKASDLIKKNHNNDYWLVLFKPQNWIHEGVVHGTFLIKEQEVCLKSFTFDNVDKQGAFL